MSERTNPAARQGAVGVTDDRLGPAFEALLKYDWGQDPQGLSAIDAAVLASPQDVAAGRRLELRLASVLSENISVVATSFVCRKLSRIGTKDSVPALARWLGDADRSHMARFALERIPGPEPVEALRDALPKASGRVKVGIINSIGVRRDEKSTDALIALLDGSRVEVAAAAAAALGEIGTAEAATALLEFHSNAPEPLRLAAADASLVCASRLGDAGLKERALELYAALDSPRSPDHIRYAAEAGRQRAIEGP